MVMRTFRQQLDIMMADLLQEKKSCEKFNDGYEIAVDAKIELLNEVIKQYDLEKDEFEVTKKILKKILESNQSIKEPLHTLHPSYYTVLFAQSIVDNNLDIERCKKWLEE